MTNKSFFEALDALETEKKIPKQVFIDTLQNALALAYKKQNGSSKAIEVMLLPEKNAIKIVASLTVVEEVDDRETQISLEDAKLMNKKYKVGDKIKEEVDSKNFGRIVAQTAKQVILQKLREVENSVAYEELAEKEEELVTCVVKRIEGKNVYVDLKKLDALLAPADQLPNDKFRVGDRVKVFVKKIKQGMRGPQIQVTRTASGFVRRLFEMEVPEIKAGQIVIKSLVREPGYRTKMAVYSEDSNIDAVGACVGNRGLRVNTIVSELGGEKIEIIPWCDDVLEFIARSLSPAKVIIVEANDDEQSATVVVKDDMLSLAIGKEGQNARLAARLTGWKIDVKPYSKHMDSADGYHENDSDDSDDTASAKLDKEESIAVENKDLEEKESINNSLEMMAEDITDEAKETGGLE